MYKQFVRSVLNPLDLWRSGDYAEIRYAREFERTQFLPQDELDDLIRQRLRHILDRSYRTIPYYKASFDKAGIVPSDIKTPKDMLAIPILEKRDLQQHFTELLDPVWPKNRLITDQTGGSTGTPVQYCFSLERKWSRQAAALRHDRWTGYEIGDATAGIWGASRDMLPPGWKQKLKQYLFPKTIILNSVCMTPENILEFNETMKRVRPSIILAYANAMAVFAATLKNRGARAYTPKGIITSAEVLRDEDRTLIEEVCGCPVFNRLGCREFSVIASECDRHDGMHTMAEGLYVELVRGDRHVEQDETGEIIVTDLLNEPMPLIRYRLGDTAQWKTGPCRCGRSLPRISNVAGRVTDFLVGMDGRLCSGVGLATFVVSQRPSFGQIQIIQEERGRILYRVGCGAASPLNESDRDFLREKTELYLGKGIQIDFEFVDSIPHEASGKFLFSKSTVAREMFRYT